VNKFATLVRVCALPLAALTCGCAGQSNASSQPGAGVVELPRPSSAQTDESPDCCKGPKPTAVAASGPLQPPDTIADAADYRRTAWLEPCDRKLVSVLDLSATDQDGRALRVSDLGGRPVALSFLYTRCTNPNKCPLVAVQMARLQRLLEAEGLDKGVRLMIMTYDPAFDTPERLKQYGLHQGLRFTPDVLMLRPDDREKGRFLDRLQVAVNYNAEGVNLHGLQLYLFDDRGRFVRRYQSVLWDNSEVLADLKRLAGEVR
jgi:cytochrome oxidase Cu insertion factor (SCO1/SenC/PrrC family)